MSDLNIKIKVKVEGLNEEVKEEIAKIKNQIPTALEQVGSEMILDLQKHTQEDWYKKYKPKIYQRRTDDNSLGIPLGSVENMSVSVKNNKLDFTYTPSGEHEEKAWEERNGDELIKWLQNEHDLASTNTGEILHTIPARPFWNNFVEEQFNEKIMQTFVRGFPKKYSVVLEGDDLETDGNESMLEAGNIDISGRDDNE